MNVYIATKPSTSWRASRLHGANPGSTTLSWAARRRWSSWTRRSDCWGRSGTRTSSSCLPPGLMRTSGLWILSQSTSHQAAWDSMHPFSLLWMIIRTDDGLDNLLLYLLYVLLSRTRKPIHRPLCDYFTYGYMLLFQLTTWCFCWISQCCLSYAKICQRADKLHFICLLHKILSI